MSEIKKIVLTGGPCAGKTTAMVRIIEHFTSLGFKVFTIPEIPTIFSQAGMNYLTDNKGLFYEGEKATLELQLGFEDRFMRMAAECHEPTIVVCDRGAMDISAYMQPEMWELDKKVIKAWTGHPHLRVINNHEDFNKKLNRVILEISHVLGLPQPIIEERKYIVELIGEIPDCTESDIVQTYLVAEPGCEIRLRRRGWQGSFVNVHTTKKRTENNKVLETERQVSNSLYESLLQQADPYRQSIRKHRKSFIWKGQYFELDTYYEPVDHLMILETKGVADQESVKFPPFIRVIEDITGNKRYYNYNLALRRS